MVYSTSTRTVLYLSLDTIAYHKFLLETVVYTWHEGWESNWLFQARAPERTASMR